jgi:SAM-dependent methyltransferase
MERSRSTHDTRLKPMSDKETARARARELAAEYSSKGETLAWFDAFYGEASGDTAAIPWADLEPNEYFRRWAEHNGLQGDGRTALVVGCGLGDDAKYLNDLGFRVVGFDISPTAIDWAKRIYPQSDIEFVVSDLFDPPEAWTRGFDFVLEIYTIQPLPMEWRARVMDAIASFVGSGGELVIVTRGREDEDEPTQMPWPVSRRDLHRFEVNGLKETEFVVMPSDEEDEPPRFVVKYVRSQDQFGS